MVDPHPAALVTQREQLLEQLAGDLLVTPGFARGLQSTLVAGLAHQTQAQNARQLGDRHRDPSVLGQIVQRLQREDKLGLQVVFFHQRNDLVEGQLLLDQFFDLLGNQGHLGTGSQRIEYMDPAVGVPLLVLPCRNGSGIVAAGQTAGDGHAVHFLRIAEGFQIFTGAGTGGRGLAHISAHIIHHFFHIGGGIVHKFPVTCQDLQRNIGKFSAFHLHQVACRVHYDLIIHGDLPFLF